jgi:hypothetical protein
MDVTTPVRKTILAEKAAILHDASSSDMDAIKKVQSRSRSFSITRDMKVFGEVPVSSFAGQSGGKRHFGDQDLLASIDEKMKRQYPRSSPRGGSPCGSPEVHGGSGPSNVHLKVAILILLIVLVGHHLWFTTRGTRED